MPQKILIVTRSFYPENSPRSFRATELAKHFAATGHDITVLTVLQPEHQEFSNKFNIRFKDMGLPKWKDIPLKGNGLVFLFYRILKRFSNLFFQYPDIQLLSMVKRALMKESGYDLMISVAVPYPIHWGVAAARKSGHPIAKVWVADCGDPFMGFENDSFRNPFYFAYVEKWFCSKADYITVPVPGAIEGYYPEFRHKIRVIPQGFDFSEIQRMPDIPVRNRPVFAYAGIFMPGRRDPREFLDFLVTQGRDYEFHIYTSTPSLVEPYLRATDGKVLLHPVIPRKELLYQLSGMDFMINFENAGNKQSPSKLIDYAILGKPILSIKTGALDTVNVDQFLSGDYSGSYRIENVDQYRIENVAKKFLGLIG